MVIVEVLQSICYWIGTRQLAKAEDRCDPVQYGGVGHRELKIGRHAKKGCVTNKCLDRTKRVS